MKATTPSEYYLSDLYDIGRRSYDDLLEEEVACLTGLIMRELDESRRLEFITESEKSRTMLCDIIRYLISFEINENAGELKYRDNRKERGGELLESITRTCTDYARTTIDRMFARKEDDFEWDRRWSMLDQSDNLRDSMVYEQMTSHTGAHN